MRFQAQFVITAIIFYFAQLSTSFHGCTKLPNLEREPKCLTKSDVQLIPDISRTKNDKRVLQKALKQLMSRDCNDVSCF